MLQVEQAAGSLDGLSEKTLDLLHRVMSDRLGGAGQLNLRRHILQMIEGGGQGLGMAITLRTFYRLSGSPLPTVRAELGQCVHNWPGEHHLQVVV